LRKRKKKGLKGGLKGKIDFKQVQNRKKVSGGKSLWGKKSPAKKTMNCIDGSAVQKAAQLGEGMGTPRIYEGNLKQPAALKNEWG